MSTIIQFNASKKNKLRKIYQLLFPSFFMWFFPSNLSHYNQITLSTMRNVKT